jgi:hypothetical protein
MFQLGLAERSDAESAVLYSTGLFLNHCAGLRFAPRQYR